MGTRCPGGTLDQAVTGPWPRCGRHELRPRIGLRLPRRLARPSNVPILQRHPMRVRWQRRAGVSHESQSDRRH